MIVKVFSKTINKKHVALLLCIFTAINSVQGTVLCFGADGHIEFESAFHQQCTNHDHFQHAAHSHQSSDAEHDEEKQCHQGQCVDIPFDFELVQISNTTEQLDRAFVAVDAESVVAVPPCDFLEYNPVSARFISASYFSPLSTIIMLA